MGLHKESVEPTWPASTSWDVKNNGHFTLVYCGTSKDRLVRADDGELMMEPLFPPKPGLTATQRSNLLLFYVLPNFFISPFPDWGIVWQEFSRSVPVGFTSTTISWCRPRQWHSRISRRKWPLRINSSPRSMKKMSRVCTAVQRCLEKPVRSTRIAGPTPGWRDIIETLRCGSLGN